MDSERKENRRDKRQRVRTHQQQRADPFRDHGPRTGLRRRHHLELHAGRQKFRMFDPPQRIHDSSSQPCWRSSNTGVEVSKRRAKPTPALHRGKSGTFWRADTPMPRSARAINVAGVLMPLCLCAHANSRSRNGVCNRRAVMHELVNCFPCAWRFAACRAGRQAARSRGDAECWQPIAPVWRPLHADG